MNINTLNLDSIQFREHVHNNDLSRVRAFYDKYKEKVLVVGEKEVAVTTFLLTNCDSSSRSPLHIVRHFNSRQRNSAATKSSTSSLGKWEERRGVWSEAAKVGRRRYILVALGRT